jgi:hypothetical protein
VAFDAAANPDLLELLCTDHLGAAQHVPDLLVFRVSFRLQEFRAVMVKVTVFGRGFPVARVAWMVTESTFSFRAAGRLG